jgi:PAS domain S-box-containing protein
MSFWKVRTVDCTVAWTDPSGARYLSTLSEASHQTINTGESCASLFHASFLNKEQPCSILPSILPCWLGIRDVESEQPWSAVTIKDRIEPKHRTIVELPRVSHKSESRRYTMNDNRKTKTELLSELAEMRKRVTELEDLESKRKHAEEELYSANQMLQLILDTIPQRVFWKDRNFSYLGCNKPFAKDAGLGEPSEIIAKDDFELGWKDVAHLYRADDKLVMETDTPKVNFEEPQTTPDGGQLWLRTSKVPLHDRRGNVVGVLGTYEDITKRKRAEEALRNEKALLDALMDNIPDSIYFKDRQCRLVRINRKEMRDLNLNDMSQVIGKTDVDLFGEEFGRKTLADEQRLMESGKPIIGLVESRQLENGQINWTSTTKVPLPDASGQIVGLVGITREINELMKAQEERQRERNLLRTLIDNLPDAVYAKDTACRKTLANLADVHNNMHRQSEAEVLGKDDFEFFPKEVAAAFFADDQSVIQSGQPVLNREEYLYDTEGHKRWLLTSKLPLRDEKGQIIGLVGIGRDITKRKQAEENLYNANQMLQLVLDTIPQRVFWKDRNFSYLGCNKTFAKDAGVGDPSNIIAKDDFELGWKNLAHLYRADDNLVMATDTPKLDFEEQATTPDGGQIWVKTSKVPLHDRDGKVIGMLGSYEDITERKRAEETVQRERNLLRTLIDNLPDLIYFKDSEGRYLLNNRPHLRSMGAEHQEDVLGKTSFDFNPRELALRYAEDEMEVVRTGKGLFGKEELALHRDTGEERWHLTSKVPLVDAVGKVTGIVGISRDITERRRAQEALLSERILLRTLIDNLPDGIYAKDTACRKTLANPADLRNMGRKSEAEVLGKDDFEFFPTEVAAAFFADDQSVIQTGQPVLNREEYLFDSEGQKRWLLTSKLPLKDEKGEINGLVGIGRDITERKRAEAEREKLIAELQSALADVKMLGGLVPICANCKKIRDDKGYWTQLEAYIQERSEARFSHGICPDCAKKLYPEIFPKEKT